MTTPCMKFFIKANILCQSLSSYFITQNNIAQKLEKWEVKLFFNVYLKNKKKLVMFMFHGKDPLELT